jgi:hypothetical protein
MIPILADRTVLRPADCAARESEIRGRHPSGGAEAPPLQNHDPEFGGKPSLASHCDMMVLFAGCELSLQSNVACRALVAKTPNIPRSRVCLSKE